MSYPNRTLPGATYMLTRRCSERRFFLRPDPALNQVFKYVLAYVAAKTGVMVHMAIVLSNHFHLIVTDPEARRPEFMRELDSLIARAMNTLYGRGESFWSPGSYSSVELIGEESVWDKLTYVACNAVAAGLVRDPLEWPGLRTTPEAMVGDTLSAMRPGVFFSEHMPEQAKLVLSVPPALAHLSPPEVVAELKARIAANVTSIRQNRKQAKLGWLGRRGVLAQRIGDSPGNAAPTRRTNPRISCRTPGRFRRELEKLNAWRQAHREARTAWISGLRDTVFPAGTYAMRVTFGVTCAPVPDG